MKALGMLEVYSFTTAVFAADICAKTGNIKVIAFDRNRPKSADAPAPLVMVVKIEGDVSDVKTAIEAGKKYAEEQGKYIVSHIIPSPGENVEKMAYRLDINKDKFNKRLPKSFLGEDNIKPERMHSIGLLEVQGLVAAIEGLDEMTKTADVRLIHTEKRLGGRLVTLVVTGKVDAVNSAVSMGKNCAEKLGHVYGDAVIANLHEEVAKFFDFSEN
ncbi:MAG: BMC domain-containing protein [Clostridia bacterium]|nr:BMC domain-containing protein [Clostridia bacterium]